MRRRCRTGTANTLPARHRATLHGHGHARRNEKAALGCRGCVERYHRYQVDRVARALLAIVDRGTRSAIAIARTGSPWAPDLSVTTVPVAQAMIQVHE